MSRKLQYGVYFRYEDQERQRSAYMQMYEVWRQYRAEHPGATDAMLMRGIYYGAPIVALAGDVLPIELRTKMLQIARVAAIVMSADLLSALATYHDELRSAVGGDATHIDIAREEPRVAPDDDPGDPGFSTYVT